jgi:hypothetical protein
METTVNFRPEVINEDEIQIDNIENTENKDNIENIENIENTENTENIENDNVKIALKKIGSRSFRTKIIEKYIRPNMIGDIENCFLWRKRWEKIASTTFCISEILGLVQTALAFSAASFNLVLISYLAGMFGVICIALNRFGSYSKNESSEKTSQLNEILVTIGIKDKIPDLMDGILQDNDNH